MTPITTFVKWANDNGIKAPHVHIAETKDAGYGLVGNQSLSNSKKSLVHIPNDMVITATRALKDNDELLNALKKIGQENPYTLIRDPQQEEFALRLFLALQKFSPKQKSSFWKPYIDVLPSLDDVRKHSVIFLNEEGLETLRGTGLYRSLCSKRSALKEQASIVKMAVNWMTPDMWFWANVVFWSRSLSIGSSGKEFLDYDNVLIPFFDFANHSLEPTIRWEPSKSGGIDLIPFDETVGSLAGNELFLLYGDDKHNEELLYLYGFTLKDNPAPPKLHVPLSIFFDMQDPQSHMKLAWVAQDKRPLMICSAPSKTKNIDIKSAGWTQDSVAMTYIAALEDDIKFECLPNMSKLSLSKDNTNSKDFVIQASIGGQVIDNLDSLAITVEKSEQFPLIQLRSIILLMNILESKFEGSQLAIPAEKLAPSMAEHIERYKQEELQSAHSSYDILEHYRDQLLQHEYVVAYLEDQE